MRGGGGAACTEWPSWYVPVFRSSLTFFFAVFPSAHQLLVAATPKDCEVSFSDLPDIKLSVKFVSYMTNCLLAFVTLHAGTPPVAVELKVESVSDLIPETCLIMISRWEKKPKGQVLWVISNIYLQSC